MKSHETQNPECPQKILVNNLHIDYFSVKSYVPLSQEINY